MLTISSAVASSVQAPVNEVGEATVDQATKPESQTTASVPLSSLVPDGGLHSVARAATDGLADKGIQSLAQQLLDQLGNKLGVGGQTPHATSNVKSQDPMDALMAVLQQIAAQLRGS